MSRLTSASPIEIGFLRRFHSVRLRGKVRSCEITGLLILRLEKDTSYNMSFFKENVRYPVWTCRDPISLLLGTRFFPILGTP